LLSRTIECGVEGVSVTHLEVTLREIDLAGDGSVLVPQCHEDSVPIGTGHGIGLGIFNPNDVQVVMGAIGRAIAVLGESRPR
jgi:hypothetical protein